MYRTEEGTRRSSANEGRATTGVELTGRSTLAEGRSQQFAAELAYDQMGSDAVPCTSLAPTSRGEGGREGGQPSVGVILIEGPPHHRGGTERMVDRKRGEVFCVVRLEDVGDSRRNQRHPTESQSFRPFNQLLGGSESCLPAEVGAEGR